MCMAIVCFSACLRVPFNRVVLIQQQHAFSQASDRPRMSFLMTSILMLVWALVLFAIEAAHMNTC